MYGMVRYDDSGQDTMISCSIQAPKKTGLIVGRSGTVHVQMCVHDQSRDQQGKCLYYAYARAFWWYLQNHCRLRNGSLVFVLCAYTRHLTLVPV